MQKDLKISLESKSDSYLINKVKNEASSEAFMEICRRYEDVFYKICQKYSSSLSSCGIYLQDIFNEKNAIILHCIKTYNPNKKTKLSSWIGNYARYLCLNSMNSKRFIVSCSDEDIKNKLEENQIFNNYSENKLNLSESKAYVFDILNQMKDKRVKDIFEYRYFNGKKMIWNKIAKKINASPQTVMSLHKRGLILIKNKFVRNENICDLI
jgi:RNA polymerase sigma factor (sigma-70 family)